jgi:hypothetical protein
MLAFSCSVQRVHFDANRAPSLGRAFFKRLAPAEPSFFPNEPITILFLVFSSQTKKK